MKRKWGQKRLTFMMIPDANKRIVRWKFPVALIYLIPSLILLLVFSAAAAVYMMFSRSALEKAALVEQFTGQISRLQQNMTEKDDQISELQSQIIDLSQQADEFKEKLDQIKALENELDDMAEKGAAKAGTTLSGTSSGTAPQYRGGAPLAISEQSMEALVTQTQDAYTQLVAEINSSLSNIASSEQILREQEHLRNITPSIWPTVSHTISSGFGIRKDPFTDKPSYHSGLDIAGKLNDPVYATAEGTVIFTGTDSTHGNHIIIDHTNGLTTHYMHLNRILVNVNDKVSKGDKIGLMGSTGRSTGPHVHYEIEKNHQPIDPTPFLKGR